jgi:putative ABC transport system permease protein
VTAAALMIGLMLVSLISILAAGTKASINQAIDASFAGNLIISNSATAGNAGIPTEIPAALRRVPGVTQVTAAAFTEGRVNHLKGIQTITAVDPPSFAKVYRIDWDSGSDATLTGLGASGTVLTKSFASAHHLTVGARLSVLTDAVDFVSYAPGVHDRQVQPAVNRILSARFPQAQSQTAKQFKASLASQVDSLLALIYVLLALSVIVSLFGIVNTLVLSIFERTRELGMLRAIGTSRRQVRQMIRYESIITALIGGVLGIGLGVAIALILAATALSGSGFVLVIPISTLVVLFVLAGLAGLGAAAWPARRAARVDILAALATE